MKNYLLLKNRFLCYNENIQGLIALEVWSVIYFSKNSSIRLCLLMSSIFLENHSLKWRCHQVKEGLQIYNRTNLKKKPVTFAISYCYPLDQRTCNQSQALLKALVWYEMEPFVKCLSYHYLLHGDQSGHILEVVFIPYKD